MSGRSSGPSHTTTTSVSKPPEYIEPYAIELMERGADLSNAEFQRYPHTQVQGLDPTHFSAARRIADRARHGSGYMRAAQQAGIDTMQGKQLGPGMLENTRYGMDNPYLNQAIENAQQDVTDQYRDVINPQLASMERASGSFGNSGLQQYRLQQEDQLAENLGDISQNMRAQDYQFGAGLEEQMRGRQQGAWNANQLATQRAASMAPEMAAADYMDAKELASVGDFLRGVTQDKWDAIRGNWQAQQQWPYQQLDVMANAIRTSMGGGGTNITSAPNANQSNRMAGLLGGGMAGYGMAKEAQWSNPWIGAGLGAMGGLF